MSRSPISPTREETIGNREEFARIQVNVIMPRKVTQEMWAAVGASLQGGHTPPVYIDLMMDAAEHIKLDDFQRATVDMAIACETFLRMLVTKNLPDNIQFSVASYIDDANIRQVLEKFVPQMLDDTGKKDLGKIKIKLHSLFDTRNGIVHKGETAKLTRELCGNFLETTRKLLSTDIGQQAAADGQAAAP